jgi:hypothetical protein
MLKSVIPERKAAAIKNRYETLEDNLRLDIIRFLNVFENNYTEALQRGEVKPIQKGLAFDVEYYLNWYNNNGFEREEKEQLLPSSKRGMAKAAVRNTTVLPSSLDDLNRCYEVIETDDSKTSWQSEYFRKESSSARRRHDALYCDPFMVPLNQSIKPSSAVTDRLESLIKVQNQELRDLIRLGDDTDT